MNIELLREDNEFFIEWIRKEWASHNDVDEFYKLDLTAEIKFKEDEFYYKIMYNNVMAGFVGLKLKDDIKFDSSILYVYRLYIDEEYRNLNIGTEVMNRLVEMANDMDRDMELEVFGPNPAIHLYERFGFKVRSVNMSLKLK